MDNPIGLPPESQPQALQSPNNIQPNPSPVPTPPIVSITPSNMPSALPPKPSLAKKTVHAIAGNSIKRAIIYLMALALVGGAAYYSGHHSVSAVSHNRRNGTCDSTYIINGSNCVPNQPGVLDEPVINLYPTKTESVNVQVTYPAGFSYTLPTYNPAYGWNVMATPSGTLTNLADNKEYPYLIWEGNSAPIKIVMNTGFVIPGNQTGTFLRAELPIIGLSPSETNAFIAYWLPKMSGDKYNLIHFVGSAYTDYARLIINPRPDSELRVMMAFEPLNNPISVKPQTFPVFQRYGFTVVEWGGTELDP